MRLNSRLHRFYSQHNLIIFSVFLITLCTPVWAKAQMTEVDDGELSRISAQAGISYAIGDSLFRVTMNSFKFSDTDSTPHNWIEFNNIIIDDGSGTGYFTMDTPIGDTDDFYADVNSFMDVNTIDVGTDAASGVTLVTSRYSLNAEPRTFTIGNFVFCNQDIGSLVFENFRTNPVDILRFSSRNDGTCGINFEYQTEIMLDSIQYVYNEVTPSSLTLSNIHLAQSASGDPTDPSSWTFTDRFKVGDLANGSPATMDVDTIESNGTMTTSIFYNIPMSGTVRVESVDFGGNNLGPCAIDGINVHRLEIQVPSGN